MNVDEMDLMSQLKDAAPLRPEAYERARTTLRASMAKSGPARVPEMAPVPGATPVRKGGFSWARNRGTVGNLGKVGIGAGIGAVAAGVAVALVVTSAPQPGAPARSVAQTRAAGSRLVSLAAVIKASSGSLPGNASLVISTQTIGGKQMGFHYNLFTDSGGYYLGATKKGLIAAIAHHDNLDHGTDARQVAAARHAATGDLTTARERMVNATPNYLGLGLSPAARKKIWAKAKAENSAIYKAKGVKFPPNPPTGKALQSLVDNYVWMNGVAALTEGGGDPQVRAGVLRLLSTIPAITVANSTTDGQSTLTLTAGPEVFGGTGKMELGGHGIRVNVVAHGYIDVREVLKINAKTGMPISSVMSGLGPQVPSSTTTFQVSRVTLADIEAGRF